MGRHGSAMVRAPWLSVIATMPSGPGRRRRKTPSRSPKRCRSRAQSGVADAGWDCNSQERRLGLRRVQASVPGGPPHAREIEIKLLVDANRLADLNDAPIVATKARNKGARKTS